MKKSLKIIILILIILTLCIGSFILGKKYSSKNNISNKEPDSLINNSNDNQKDENVNIKQMINNSTNVSDKEKNDFLNKILGEYLHNSYDEHGEKIYCGGMGIYLSIENTTYKYLNYQLCTDGGITGTITKVSKYNDKYIIKIHYPHFEGVLTSSNERLLSVIIDISGLKDGKITIIGSINEDLENNTKNINDEKLEYLKYNGSFDDWESKINF